MSTSTRIREFFDGVSPVRDKLLDGHEIIRYEQLRRQHLVLRLLEPRAGEWILDVGCGNARDLRVFAARHMRPVGVDFSFGMLTDAKCELRRRGQSVALVQAEGARLPFRSCSFDKVVCSEVIEHVPAAAELVRELYGVLKPGGTLVVTTPNRVSLYGVYRKIGNAWGAIKRAMRPDRVDDSRQHPFDQWKTRKELVTLLGGAGFQAIVSLNACYVPSHVTYRFPVPLKRFVVGATAWMEGALEAHLKMFGYTIGVAARRPAVPDTPGVVPPRSSGNR